ncbi:hypothetical protein DPMN_048539 [Dreissena polymorpha]|uniref:Uncharacterized protein n=1 Tax=Dreissena polymorpha TaxID=45954 RepID=A0A9D4D9S6_DREPO|nr:hypothetical protein DPMN_048539 [Dreissena polymorpha]
MATADHSFLLTVPHTSQYQLTVFPDMWTRPLLTTHLSSQCPTHHNISLLYSLTCGHSHCGPLIPPHSAPHITISAYCIP